MSVETALDDLDCLADNATAMVVLFSDPSESDTIDSLPSNQTVVQLGDDMAAERI